VDFGASEDATYFMERVQSRGGQACYLLIGSSLAAGHHDNHFDFDEQAISKAIRLLSQTARDILA